MPSPSTNPTPTDDALLARLNALKKSSITLDTTSSASITPTPKVAAHTDDLAARFARLGSASPSASPKLSRTTSEDTHTARAKGAPALALGASSYLEGVAEGIGGASGVEFNEEDERSLEELLGRLGERGDWDIEEKEERDIGGLLRDVKAILPEVRKSMAKDTRERGEGEGKPGLETGDRRTGEEDDKGRQEKMTDWENVQVDIGSEGVKIFKEEEQEHSDADDGEKKMTEDEETDDLIARIMAELEISKKYGDIEDPPRDEEDEPPNPESQNEEQQNHSNDTQQKDTEDAESDLTLPSAPTALPHDSLDQTQDLEDALTARFASLSNPASKSASDFLGLPSAPSFAPNRKPSNVTHTDEEVDSWCIICYDDATLKCLGCDGDLYCQKCWMEGHRGESAGFEERRHKAVLYSKKKKQEAAAG